VGWCVGDNEHDVSCTFATPAKFVGDTGVGPVSNAGAFARLWSKLRRGIGERGLWRQYGIGWILVVAPVTYAIYAYRERSPSGWAWAGEDPLIMLASSELEGVVMLIFSRSRRPHE